MEDSRTGQKEKPGQSGSVTEDSNSPKENSGPLFVPGGGMDVRTLFPS